MFYERKIKYLDLYDKEERIQNAGFVRLEAREEGMKLQLRIEKLGHTNVGKVQAMLRGGEKEAVLGELMLEKGNGVLECEKLHLEDLAQGISYEELNEIYIKLSGERRLRCIVKEPEKRQAVDDKFINTHREENVVSKEQGNVSNVEKIREDEVTSEALMFQIPTQEPGSISEQMPPLMPWPETEIPLQQMYNGDSSMSEMNRPEDAASQERRQAEENTAHQKVHNEERPMSEMNRPEDAAAQERRQVKENTEPQQMYSGKGQMPRTDSIPGPVLRPMSVPPLQERLSATTKWQQLSDIYPHIRPFEDERDYLKIKPEDFVILVKKYYPLITNSFLKHGYYNYEHLILAREKRKDGEHFYIGVPGNFYDKEKQIAVLFGFESFEGKREPAKSGDFGYYMISVEI